MNAETRRYREKRDFTTEENRVNGGSVGRGRPLHTRREPFEAQGKLLARTKSTARNGCATFQEEYGSGDRDQAED